MTNFTIHFRLGKILKSNQSFEEREKHEWNTKKRSNKWRSGRGRLSVKRSAFLVLFQPECLCVCSI